jgi:ABC-type multidrug transport system permease subunit/uncharacterized protein YoxC
MKKVLELIKKNFRLILRSKFSALIILIGPLIIMLLAGLAFSNTNQYSINIGTFSEQYNELTNSYINNLEDNSYSVFKTEDKNSCIELTKDGKYHVCIVFPKDFAIGQDNKSQINFYVDYSKINLVYVVIESVTSEISESSSKISQNLTANILSKIEATESELKGKDELINNLITKNSEIDTSLSEIDTQLTELDLSYDSNNFKTNTLSSYTNQLKSSLSDMNDETESFVSDMSNLMEDIENDVNDLNISGSEKNSILNSLESINNSVEALGGNVSSEYNETRNKSSQMLALISDIEDSLEDIESRLSSARSTRSNVLEKVEQAKSKVSTSRVSLLDLQDTINTINQGISSISLRDAEDIVNPTNVKINPVISEKTHLNYFFPALLTLIIMFVSVLLASNLTMMEKTSSAHLRNHITPTKDIIFLLANYFTCLFIMIFQIFVLFLISILLFNISINIFSSQFFILGLLALIISTVFVFFGMFIGYLFKSRETSTLGAISFSTLFFVLSDVIVPIESIPSELMFLTKFNPFMISAQLFRQVILFGENILSLGPNLYYILIYLVIFFALTMTSLIHFKKTHIMDKLSKKEHSFISKIKKKKK